MSDQNFDQKLNDVDEAVINQNLAQPFGKDYLENLSIEQLKHLNFSIHWRVRNIIGDDFNPINASSSEKFVSDHHPYRKVFKTESLGVDRVIKYRGMEVYNEQTLNTVLGRWIYEFQDFANQIKAQELNYREIEEKRLRATMIESLTKSV